MVSGCKYSKNTLGCQSGLPKKLPILTKYKQIRIYKRKSHLSKPLILGGFCFSWFLLFLWFCSRSGYPQKACKPFVCGLFCFSGLPKGCQYFQPPTLIYNLWSKLDDAGVIQTEIHRKKPSYATILGVKS